MKPDRCPDSYEDRKAFWDEWLTLCTVDRCGARGKKYLRRKGVVHMRDCLGRLFAKDTCLDLLEPRERPWLVFEQYMHEGPRSGGKRYKDWLCAKAQQVLREDKPASEWVFILEKLVEKCFLTVARRWLRSEGEGIRDSNGHIRLKQLAFERDELENMAVRPSVGGAHQEDDLGVDDLLPSVAENFGRIDKEEVLLAASHIDHVWEQLTERQKLVMAAVLHDRPLYRPDILAQANCKKDALYTDLKRIHATVRAVVDTALKAETAGMRFDVCQILIRMLSIRVLEWLQKPENAGTLSCMELE
jgi:hypothetical protein